MGVVYFIAGEECGEHKPETGDEGEGHKKGFLEAAAAEGFCVVAGPFDVEGSGMGGFEKG